MLEWNVFVFDFNDNKIRTTNILKDGHFLRDCGEAFKKYKNDEKKIKEEIEKSLMYYYWCRYEYETTITSYPISDRYDGRRIDIYGQVMMNWKPFFEYVFSHKSEILKAVKE